MTEILIIESMAYCTGIVDVCSGCAINGYQYSKLSGHKKPKTEGPRMTPAIISPSTEGSLNCLKSSAKSRAIIKIVPSAIKKTIISWCCNFTITKILGNEQLINYKVNPLANTPNREGITDPADPNVFRENSPQANLVVQILQRHE